LKTDPSDEDHRVLNPIFTTSFVSKIAGDQYKLPIEVQSGGVKRIYSTAASVCMSIAEGSLLLVDEIDASMHPHMVAKLVSIFQNKSTNPNGSQLIFTTHDSHLMNIQHLRRDQVWFAEKNDGLSELYSLTEFSPRKNENLESGYLRGKFGAVPSTGINLRLLGLDGDLEIKSSGSDDNLALDRAAGE
jgi:AAA15 family ATPase/GTPase